ncbi:hypothetical protein ON010_g11366 [Phytophthora cinnamomi]|nr:hypothetical protein ON010_g11366 [Phytophthora cinnamomi]
MKQLLHRVGGVTEQSAAADNVEKVDQPKPFQRRTSAPVDPITAALAARKRESAAKAGTAPSDGRNATKLASSALLPTTSVGVASETERIPKIVHRARTVQSLIRRSCVDAGTDPLESLMIHNRPVGIQTPAQGCEMETQTTLPPAPLLSVSKSGSLRDPESKFVQAEQEQHEQNNETSTRPEEMVSEPTGGDSQWEPQQDGDAIEAEMKLFLMQHAMENASPEDNQSRPEEQPEEDVDPAKFWSDSPRLDPIKTAELRKPPTSLSRTGYRTFRMPSRPSSSDNIQV